MDAATSPMEPNASTITKQVSIHARDIVGMEEGQAACDDIYRL